MAVVVFALGFAIVPNVIGPASKAFACSCQSQSESQKYAASTVVFFGTAVSSTEASTYTWTFDVDQVLKGDVGSVAQIEVPKPDVTDCGFTLEKGERYEVYAYLDGSVLRSGLCSGTRRLAATGVTPYVPSNVKPRPPAGGGAAPNPSAPVTSPAPATPAPKGTGSPPGQALPSRGTSAPVTGSPVADKAGPGLAIGVAITAVVVALLGGATFYLRRRAG